MYLCKPTRETIENWKTLLSLDVSDLLSPLRVTINEIDLNSRQELEDLLWEYTRLFIGPYKLPCPPWESVYTSSKRLMMQDAYDEVKNIYTKIGLTINNPDIMYDHIGAELNFMAVLFQKMDNEPQNRLFYMDIAKRFLEDHLIKWIPQFTMDMEKATDSQFFKALAQVTRNLVNNKFT